MSEWQEMIDAKTKKIQKQHKELFERVYRDIPEKYHCHIVDLGKSINLQSKQNPVWVNDLPSAYFTVAGRQAWCEDDHNEKDGKYVLLTQINNSAISLLMEISIPAWATVDGKSLAMQIMVPGNGAYCLFSSSIRGMNDGIATVHSKKFALEDADTSAVGRALGKAGYGNTSSGFASLEEAVAFMTYEKEEEEKAEPKEEKKATKKNETVLDVALERIEASDLEQMVREDDVKELQGAVKKLRTAMKIDADGVKAIYRPLLGKDRDEKIDFRTEKIPASVHAKAYEQLAMLANFKE